MTSRLLMPSRRAVPGPWGNGAAGSLAVTAVLDRSPATLALVERLPDADVSTRLRAAHGLVRNAVRPVYALDDVQPVSVTLRRGRGSCSQRLAVLEDAARADGVPTRTRGLLVDGRFWYPRFRGLTALVPEVVVVPWLELLVQGDWRSVSELFGPVRSLAAAGGGFTNADGETLFDAVARTAVDWEGRTSDPGSCSACDLSRHVLADLGTVDSREQLLDAVGPTVSRPARLLLDPVLSRWSPRSTR